MANDWSQEKYSAALIFAAMAHKNQKVPGTSYSYVVHIAAVTMEMIAALAREGVADSDLAVQCALLHDVIEDTEMSCERVKDVFGTAVADGVLALSKDPNLPKNERMPDSLERILRQPPEVQMVKLADRINNLRKPPDYWSAKKKLDYRKEARLILSELSGSSRYLADRLAKKIEDYSAFL